jgi:pyridinium-3,5-bisthiocarboxylic acid mononucleotide nickel chelatase
MRVGHLDPCAGASGDMLLAALVDAGAPVDGLREVLAGLALPGWSLHAEPVVRGGIASTAVKVAVADDAPTRRWADIRRLLADARLPEPVRQRATAAFQRLAVAEARIHAVDEDAVVFHELGGLDTIIDLVGVCAGVQLLGLDRLSSAPVAQGTGTVATAHGPLPVPAPAVLELLRGVPTFGVDERVELCTPTGAALLAELVDDWGPLPAMTVEGVGYGAGSREHARPNVLRLTVGDATGGRAAEDLVLLEATVDDMAGELVPVVLDALRAAGANDAWARQVLMKKGRPGVELVALVDEARAGAVRTALFRQSTTLGVRAQPVSRWALDREVVDVEVAGHRVRVKLGCLDGRVVNAAPEFDDCAAAATATGLAVKDVMDRARTAWRQVEAR